MRLKSKRMNKREKLIDNIFVWALRIGIVFAIIWFVWAQNNFVISQEFIYGDKSLPKSLVGYNIVHVSDIKNSDNNVYRAVKRLEPDIIVLTGGYSDSDGKYDNTIKTVNKLCEIAPVYYINNPGDKGDVIGQTGAIELTNANVIISPEKVDAVTFIREIYGNTIINKAEKGDEQSKAYLAYITEVLAKDNSTINLFGIDNYLDENGEYNENLIYQARDKAYELVLESPDSYQVALLGNVALLEEVCKADIDTMLFGGTFGTNQISDTYIKGMYGYNGTQLFVSSGVGNKDGKIRIMNFPCVQSLVLSDGTITKKNPLEDLLGKVFKDVGTIFDNDGGFEIYTYSGEELQD